MQIQVNNTFGERHSYVIATDEGDPEEVRQGCDKQFHVSPFMPMQCRYGFRIRPPGDAVSAVINQTDGEGPLLCDAFRGDRLAFTDRGLAACLALLARAVIYALVPTVLKVCAICVMWSHPITSRRQQTIRRRLDQMAERNMRRDCE